MKTNKISIILYGLMGLVIAYALACIVNLCVHFSFVNILYIIITLIACTVFSAILFFSAKMKWGEVLEKHGRTEEAEMYNKAIEKMQEEEEAKSLTLSDKIAKEKHTSESKTLTNKTPFNVKNFLIGLFILLVFGGAGSEMTYFASTEHARITGADFVKTTATIEEVVLDEESGLTDLRYVFIDADGNEINAKFNSGFDGLVPMEGNQVTIYYNRQDPQKVETLSTPVMCYLVGIFFIIMSSFAFISLCGFNTSGKNKLAPIIIGSIFSGLAATVFAALYMAVGGSFVQVLLSGGGMYAVGCFGILGFYFLLFGIIGLLKAIFKSIVYGGKI